MEPATRSIGARSYTVAPLPAFKALDVFEMLSVVIGPAITALAAAGQSGEVQPVAEALFKQLGGGKLRNLANQLLEGVLVEEAGKTAMMTVGFDIRYAGQLFEVFKVMAFVVEVNYRDFFDGVVALIEKFFPEKGGGPSSGFPTT